MRNTLLSLSVCVCSLAALNAATLTNTLSFNTTDGNWNVAGNWNENSTTASYIPGAEMAAIIGLNTSAVINDGATYAAGNLWVRGGTLTVSSGTLAVNRAADAFVQWGAGQANATSTLYIGSGGTVTNVGANVVFGQGNNSTNSLVVDGGTFSMLANNMLMIGMGTGGEALRNSTTMTVTNGGTFSSLGVVSVGRDAYSTGKIIVDNSYFKTTGAVNVGDNNITSMGELVLTNASFSSGNMTIGNLGGGTLFVSGATANVSVANTVVALGSTGTLSVTGGAKYYSNTAVVFGQYNSGAPNSAATVTVSGTDTAFTVNGAITVGRSAYDNLLDNKSYLYVGDGAQITAAAALYIGAQTGNTGTGSTFVAGPGGYGVMTMSSATYTMTGSGASLNVGGSATGELYMTDSTIYLGDNQSSHIGTVNRADDSLSYMIHSCGDGNGYVSMTNSQILGVTTTAGNFNSRLYIGHVGEGTLVLNDSTVSNMTIFQIGTYLYRTLNTSQGMISDVLGTGSGTVVLNGNSYVSIMPTTTSGVVQDLVVGRGGSGTLIVNGGTLTTGGAIRIGEAGSETITISSGGSLTSSVLILSSTGSLQQTGGSIYADSLYIAGRTLTATTGTVANGEMIVTGGVTTVNTLSVGAGNTLSSATLNVASGGKVVVNQRFVVGNYATLSFTVKGNDFSQPLIDASGIGGADIILYTNGIYEIDLTGVTSTDADITITLMAYDTRPSNYGNITFQVDYDDTKYIFDADTDIIWDVDGLKVHLQYIPEPAMAGALMALLALTLAARRRK